MGASFLTVGAYVDLTLRNINYSRINLNLKNLNAMGKFGPKYQNSLVKLKLATPIIRIC